MTTTKWTLDSTHSEVQFKVKHLMITNITGNFPVINAEIQTEENDFSKGKISFTANVSSVTTNNEQRDGHLKSADFFDVEKYPTVKFESTSFDVVGSKLKGNLIIKGITKPVILDAEFHGINKDPWGTEKAGFSVSGKINRKDWDLNWNAALETGGVLVSDDVRIYADVQFVKTV